MQILFENECSWTSLKVEMIGSTLVATSSTSSVIMLASSLVKPHSCIRFFFSSGSLMETSENGSRNWKYLILLELILRDLTWRNLSVLMDQPWGNRCPWETAPSNTRSQCQRVGFSSQVHACWVTFLRMEGKCGDGEKENSLENFKLTLSLWFTHHHKIHLSLSFLYIDSLCCVQCLGYHQYSNLNYEFFIFIT